jgi:phospholipid/cholesterol/gamma-HCH transport system substrate-binding protein
MLQSRTLREGSVGLLVLLGLGLFGTIALWLRGINFGTSSYKIIAEFDEVNGMQVGESVRYRGLKVGKVKDIKPGANGIDVIIEIASSELVIPKQVTLQANSSGLIGEKSIDINPEEKLPKNAQAFSPIENCNPNAIVCDGDRIKGEPGITIDDLLPIMARLSTLYTSPEFYKNLNTTLQNTGVAADEFAQLSRDTSGLMKDARQEIATFRNTANAITKLANNSSAQLTTTAAKYNTTADKINELTTNVNQLVAQNRTSLNKTLANIGTTSDQLQTLLVGLNSSVGKLNSSIDATDTKKLVKNLETLTDNAAVASKNLRDISTNLNSPQNVTVLQQTLDSARVTFENAQKITSDLDDLTGDPAFRDNVRNLVNGLGNLVSSTEQLQQEMQTARVLEPVSSNLKQQIKGRFSEGDAKLSQQKVLVPNLFNKHKLADRNYFLDTKAPAIASGFKLLSDRK